MKALRFLFVLSFVLTACQGVQTPTIGPALATSTLPPTLTVVPATTAAPSFTDTPVATETPAPKAKPSATPFTRRLSVFPDQPLQTVAHLGSGNFIHYFGGTTTATEPISQLNLDRLQPRFARLSIELQEWEPQNDNADPKDINAAAFRDDQHNHATFELMKTLQARGVELTATVWRVPNWMVDDPKIESPRVITQTMYSEAVESIAAWLLHAKEQYGVEVAYVSFNEANLGITVLLTPADYIEMIRQGGKRFAELGLKTKWLLGDCSSIGGCLDYVKGIYAAEDIHPYLGPLAFHNWDGTSVGDATIAALGDWAEQHGLETRCTEGGWDAQLWQRPQEFPGWANARQLMISYARTLKTSRATAFYYWEMMGGDYALNNGTQPYPVMEMLIQLNQHFPPGAQIVATSPGNGTLYFVAATTPGNGFTVLLVNDSLKERLQIDGLPAGEYDLFTNTKDILGQLSQTLAVNDGKTTFEMPGFSVGFLVKKNSP